MARASVEAPRWSGIRSGSMRCGCGLLLLRCDKSRFLRARSSPTRAPTTCRRRSGHEPALPPPRLGHPRALHVSRAIVIAALAASPAPPITTILLRLVPTVLARRRSAAVGSRHTHPILVLNQIPRTLVQLEHRTLLLQILPMLRFLLLPQVNSPASAPIIHQRLIFDPRRTQTRRRAEERDDADAERGCGVRAVDRVRVRHDGLVVVVMVVVERRSRRNHEEVAQAEHAAHLRRETVIN